MLSTMRISQFESVQPNLVSKVLIENQSANMSNRNDIEKIHLLKYYNTL